MHNQLVIFAKASMFIAAFVIATVTTEASDIPETQKKRPNILLIVADDLGFADIGAFGGEIATPNIDALAQNGLRLSRFYTSSQCSPTRAMLMSGVDSHRAGLGAMMEGVADSQRGKPGYEGYLNKNAITVATLLRDAGYHTSMAGKWHLGTEVDLTPTARGFDRSFALLTGSASHYDDMSGPTMFQRRAKYWEDGKRIYDLPKGFYSSDFYTSKILDYIDSTKGGDKPFFAYLAFTAPHWPLHAPDSDMARYRGKYDAGYDVIRANRFAKLQEQGIIAPEITLPPLPGNITPWDNLTPEERKTEAKMMEIYAAMVDRMDYNIGRIIKYLKRNGQYENTVIMFISDNGADGFPMVNFPVFADWVKRFDNSYDNVGKKGSFPFYSSGWAQAGEAPFRLYKWYSTEGGIRAPAIIRAPGLKNRQGEIDTHIFSVLDVLPTFIELAGTKHPKLVDTDSKLEGPIGKSFASLLTKQGMPDQKKSDETIFAMEIVGRQALIKGDWKILWIEPPLGSGTWELYNVTNDPAEQKNLTDRFPDKKIELLALWQEYIAKNNVILPKGHFSALER